MEEKINSNCDNVKDKINASDEIENSNEMTNDNNILEIKNDTTHSENNVINEDFSSFEIKDYINYCNMKLKKQDKIITAQNEHFNEIELYLSRYRKITKKNERRINNSYIEINKMTFEISKLKEENRKLKISLNILSIATIIFFLLMIILTF